MTHTPSDDARAGEATEREATAREQLDDPLVDENAFGLWLGWYDAEEVEYAQSADKFPPRILVFRSAVRDFLESFPLGRGVTALETGTAVYLEVADGDQTEDPIAWMRSFRAFLAQGDWVTFCAVTYGGRWRCREPSAALPARVGDVSVLASFGPSEPLRRAMAAEISSHDDEEGGLEGWGAGLFVDAEALEALGKKLKNEPTPLRRAGACFFRIGG
jgi:hypothetical protein